MLGFPSLTLIPVLPTDNLVFSGGSLVGCLFLGVCSVFFFLPSSLPNNLEM